MNLVLADDVKTLLVFESQFFSNLVPLKFGFKSSENYPKSRAYKTFIFSDAVSSECRWVSVKS